MVKESFSSIFGDPAIQEHANHIDLRHGIKDSTAPRKNTGKLAKSLQLFVKCGLMFSRTVPCRSFLFFTWVLLLNQIHHVNF